jgi:hypothetical protein
MAQLTVPVQISSLPIASQSNLSDRFAVDQISNAGTVNTVSVTASQILANAAAYNTVTPYTLPVASSTTLGGILIGSGFNYNATNGLLSVVLPTYTAYTLPTATSLSLGGIMAGSGTSIDSNGVLSVGIATQLNVGLVKTGTGGLTVATDGTLTLPPATNSIIGGVIAGTALSVGTTGILNVIPATTATLGGIKVGNGLSVDTSGVLSVIGSTMSSSSSGGSYTLLPATATTLGGIISGSGTNIDVNGVLSVAFPLAYTLPAATSSTLGGIKQGAGLIIASSGTLSLSPATSNSIGGIVVGTGFTNSSGTVSLAAATNSTIGGIMPGLNCSVTNGVLNVATGSYTLPQATASVLGGVIVSNGLTIASGFLSVVYGSAANTAAQGNDSRITGAAPIASPAFTGIPSAPTASVGTNTTQIATTAYVQSQGFVNALSYPTATNSTLGLVSVGSGLTVSSGAVAVAYGTSSSTAAIGNDSRILNAAPTASPTFTGVPIAPTATAGTNTQQIATTAFVLGQSFLTSASLGSTYALVASPTFTGTPTAPTPPANNASTQLATTQFVTSAINSLSLGTSTLAGDADVSISNPVLSQALIYNGTKWTNAATVSTVAGRTGTVTLSVADISGAAATAGPQFSGVPTAPTAAVNTNTTQLATTAYVINQGYVTTTSATATYATIASPALTGTPTSQTPATNDNSLKIATTAWVANQAYLTTSSLASTYAPLASPALTGTPTAPTAATSTNTTQLATTAWVRAYLTSIADADYAGDGNPGIVHDNGSGVPTTVNTHQLGAHNLYIGNLTNFTIIDVLQDNMSIIGMWIFTPNSTSPSSSNYVSFTLNLNGTNLTPGSSVSGDYSAGTYTIGNTLTYISFTTPIAVSGTQNILQLYGAKTGTCPQFYAQFVANWS